MGVLMFSRALTDADAVSLPKRTSTVYLDHISFRFYSLYRLEVIGESLERDFLTSLCLLEKFRNPRLNYVTLVRVKGIPKTDFLGITHQDSYLGFYDDSPESPLSLRKGDVISLLADFNELSRIYRLDLGSRRADVAVDAMRTIQNGVFRDQVRDISYSISHWDGFCEDCWNFLSERCVPMNFLAR